MHRCVVRIREVVQLKINPEEKEIKRLAFKWISFPVQIQHTSKHFLKTGGGMLGRRQEQGRGIRASEEEDSFW